MDEVTIESKAKDKGWVSKEDFKGNSENWRDAETFLNSGYPETLASRLKEATVRINEMNDTLSQFKDHHNQTLKRERKAHEQELKELKKVQRAAVKDGDEVAYDKASEQIDTLEVNVSDQLQQKQDNEVKIEYDKFVDRNPWFMSNDEMRSVAEGVSNSLVSKNPRMTVSDNMRKTENRIRELYPEHFENKRRKSPTSVEDGTSTAVIGQNKGKMTFANLPMEAQKAGKRFVKEKLYDNIDEYVRDFEKGMS